MGRNLARTAVVIIGVWTLVAIAVPSWAQGPDTFFVTGRNVNTLGPAPAGPNPSLAGNPKHKQRNEDSCDVSPQNPWVVLCANNDYRGIELFDDSWIGLSMTNDGGRTWRDRLLDGFPATKAGKGAADPVVRTVPGLGLVSYITLSRTDGRGTLSLAVLLERNKENGEPYQFFQTRLIGNGTPGRFNDKPAMIAVLDAAGGTTTVGGRTVPKGTIHFGYSLFPGNENNSSSQMYHTSSRDYGLTWSSPKKLSESLGVNQGMDLAVDDLTNTIVATWRQIADTNQGDAIAFSRSDDGGQTWSKAKALWTAPAGAFFDQETSAVQFRTRSMPSIVHDGAAFHAFWSARGFAANPDDARIVVSSSRDGRNWSTPAAIANFSGRGHQIIPQAAVAGGRIQVDWIDTRNNEPGTFGRYIADFRTDANGQPVALDAPSPPAGSPAHLIYRQSGDIYAAQAVAASANGSPSLGFSASQAISRYRFGLVNGVRRQLEYNFLNARIFQKGAVAFNGDYHALAGQRYRPSETTAGAWIRNTLPSTTHAIFYSAFTDNRDIQGYVWAGPPATSFTFPGVSQEAESGFELAATCSASGETSQDQTVWTPGDSPRSRYQNIYAATTLPGLVMVSPSGSKPTGTLERAYVVFVQNLTGQDRQYQMNIANQPGDGPPGGTGRASFRPGNPAVPPTNCVPGTDCRTINVTIPRGSSITRTVYVRSSLPRPRILVTAAETGGSQNGSVLLNANPAVAEIENPDSLESLPDILTGESYQPQILSRQFTFYTTGVINPDVVPVTDVTNPRIEYPRIEYPRIEYPRIEYDAVGTPRIEYPRIEYPRIEYSSVQNPRIEYSPLSGDGDGVTSPTQIAEVTWPVATGTGANTLTGMSSSVFLTGVVPTCTSTLQLNCVQGAQLLVSTPQFYSVTRSCDGEQMTVVENHVTVNSIVDVGSLAPSLSGPDTVNPLSTQPTFFVGPKQIVFLTLRLAGHFDANFAAQLGRRAGLIVRSQPDISAIDQSNDDQDGTIDITPPTLILGDVGALANVEGNDTGGANVSVTASATDDAGAASVSCVRTGPSGTVPLPSDGTSSFVPLGAWSATCTAADVAGNESSGSFPIGVVDTIAPILTPPAAIQQLATSASGAVVTFGVTAADVVDAAPSVVCVPPSGSLFPIGVTTVSCTARDGSGNTSTSSFTVTVRGIVTTTTIVAPDAVHDGLPHGAVATVTGLGLNAPVPVVYTGTNGTSYGPSSTPPTAAGTYIATATYAANGDYLGSSATATFRITSPPPPALSITASPNTLLWSPNKLVLPVTVSGVVTGIGVTTVSYTVADEYGKFQPSGTAALDATGRYSFVVNLEAYRNGNDANGRIYTVTVTAQDQFGRTVVATAIVRVPHNQ